MKHHQRGIQKRKNYTHIFYDEHELALNHKEIVGETKNLCYDTLKNIENEMFQYFKLHEVHPQGIECSKVAELIKNPSAMQ